jgi:biotin carboxylase
VEVAGSTAKTLWRISRSVTRFHITPSLRDPSEYVEAVIRICRERAITAFFPSCGEVTALAPFHDRLAAHTSYPFAGEPLIALLNNKDWLTTKAAKLGIPVPQSVTVESGANPEVPRDMKFPLVCKPASSLGAKGFTIVTTRSQLRGAVATAPPGDLDLWIVQELVPGPLYVWNGIYWNGSVRAACVFEALKTTPAIGGASVLRRSVCIPELDEFAGHLLSGIGYQGVCVLDFIRDERTGRFLLIDLNPRFGTSLHASLAAGVSLPTCVLKLVREERFSLPAPRTGVLSSSITGHLGRLFRPCPRRPALASLICDFLVALAHPRAAEEIFLGSPLPFLFALYSAVAKPFHWLHQFCRHVPETSVQFR